MIDAEELYGPRGNGGHSNGSLLTGRMLPKGVKTLIIRVTGVRKAPETWETGKLIIDYKYAKTTAEFLRGSKAERAHSWGVNQTNANRLRAYLSELDDFEELVGAYVKLKVVLQRNPKEKREVPSFEVRAVKMFEDENFVEYPPQRLLAEESEEESEF
jgi:hypothetical protein